MSGLVPDLTAVDGLTCRSCVTIPRGVAISPSHPYVELALYLATHRDRQADGSRSRVLRRREPGDNRDRPALFSVGLMDQVCHRRRWYAAYNLPGPKQMRVYPYNEHEGGQGSRRRSSCAGWRRELMPAP